MPDSPSRPVVLEVVQRARAVLEHFDRTFMRGSETEAVIRDLLALVEDTGQWREAANAYRQQLADLADNYVLIPDASVRNIILDILHNEDRRVAEALRDADAQVRGGV